MERVKRKVSVLASDGPVDVTWRNLLAFPRRICAVSRSSYFQHMQIGMPWHFSKSRRASYFISFVSTHYRCFLVSRLSGNVVDRFTEAKPSSTLFRSRRIVERIPRSSTWIARHSAMPFVKLTTTRSMMMVVVVAVAVKMNFSFRWRHGVFQISSTRRRSGNVENRIWIYVKPTRAIDIWNKMSRTQC